MQKAFGRSLDSLESIYEFTERTLTAGDIGDAVRFPVHLAIEELFVNMLRYCPDSEHDILLDVDILDGRVTVTVTDFDADPFDVTQPRQVATDAPLDERTPGGLGLHLIQRMVDTLEYHYDDRRSTIKFTKE